MNHLWPSDKYIPRHLRRQGVISRPGRWKACRHTGSRARRSWTACSRRTGPACRKGEACPRTAEIALMFSPWARLSVANVCLSEYGLASSKPVRPTKRSHSFLKVLYDLVQTSSATTGRPSSDLIPISRRLSPFSSMATRARNRPPLERAARPESAVGASIHWDHIEANCRLGATSCQVPCSRNTIP